MVKVRIEGETKKGKFRRIATARTSRILENLRLLGNCANHSTYDYDEKEIDKIFSTIERELKRTKSLFDKPNTEFSLD
ncbi:hypothetical protein AUJ14_01680 [Candidatus Micrarchaeota archaeon CG1_02_55_22]|nr:MAG: hypothetical protein AUJ14_01680 [Candidatus Micrarchaeota archaeon CG1_02_55_22]